MNVHDPELLNLQATKQSEMLPDLLPRISASLDPQYPHLPELFVWIMDSLFVDMYIHLNKDDC